MLIPKGGILARYNTIQLTSGVGPVQYVLDGGMSAAAARESDIACRAADDRGDIDGVGLGRRGVGHSVGDHHGQRSAAVCHLHVEDVSTVQIDARRGQVDGRNRWSWRFVYMPVESGPSPALLYKSNLTITSLVISPTPRDALPLPRKVGRPPG